VSPAFWGTPPLRKMECEMNSSVVNESKLLPVPVWLAQEPGGRRAAGQPHCGPG